MKKFLVAALVVIMATITVPAFAAANPFMDVPASHWAYDAVAQLASRGIISGYPDGSYKGAQPATRYEMASIVARAMAKVDMEKASKQDVEMLKKLIVEFKDELDALGVKVDKIDARLAVMEKDLGGWSLAGEFRFDAKFGSDNDENGWYGDDFTFNGKNEFDLNRYRLFIRKRINENTNFTARLGRAGGNDGNAGVRWERYYVTTKLGYDITLTAGRQLINWEEDLGLYGDNEPMLGSWAFNMLMLEKDWGMANLKLLVGRHNDDGWTEANPGVNNIEHFLVAGMANFSFNEQFRAGLIGYYFFADEEVRFAGTTTDTDTDLGIYGAYVAYAFTPSIELKALYYYQDQGDTIAQAMTSGTTDYDDSANAWKVMLDVKQDALKFTSLWLEYGQTDNNFMTNDRFNDTAGSDFGAFQYSFGGASLLHNMPFNTNTSKIYGVRMDQQWNDKWRTFGRYFAVDHDTDTVDDAFNWTLGVGYRLNPAVEFELAYDAIDYGNGTGNLRNGDDNIIRFRTYVTF